MVAYILLGIAIASEVFGSTILKMTDGFKKLLPSIGVIAGYLVAFYTLSITLQTIPLGTAYAIWAGVGTALTALMGVLVYKEKFNTKKIIGMVLIISGVVLLNIGGAH